MKVINTTLAVNMSKEDRIEEQKKMYLKLHTNLVLENKKKKQKK